MLLRHALSSCLLVLLATSSMAALAAPPARGAPTEMSSRPRDDDALSDSVRRVERSSRGQVLSAERVPFDGRDVNRIKTVDDRGRVRIYMDDPRSAQPPQPESPASSPTRGNDD
jgi:hypothetical protein